MTENKMQGNFVIIIAIRSSSCVQIGKIGLHHLEPEESNQADLFCRH